MQWWCAGAGSAGVCVCENGGRCVQVNVCRRKVVQVAGDEVRMKKERRKMQKWCAECRKMAVQGSANAKGREGGKGKKSQNEKPVPSPVRRKSRQAGGRTRGAVQ